ncbi:MAG: MaoC family dehydratase N-terminal domain-containing protein [Alphaproteobacteria bacterium]|nr:MaoC family dehydratase N-terminal domain-containing protein [Alphaproteobacteria bacterium]
MSELISAEARSWIGRSADPVRIEISRTDIRKYAIATEQQQAKFLNGDEAPAMFLFGALRPLIPMDQLGPDGIPPDKFLPDLPLKRVMAGGTEMQFHRSVKPGDVLIATRSLHDLVEKQGKTGPLIFVSYNLRVETEAGELVLEEKQTRIFR